MDSKEIPNSNILTAVKICQVFSCNTKVPLSLATFLTKTLIEQHLKMDFISRNLRVDWN